MTVKKLEPEEIAAYARSLRTRTPSTVARRIEAGSRIYAAWSDGRIISAGWLELDRALFDAVGACIPIGPKVVYARASYTDPELRGRNIATVAYVTALELLREEGFERGRRLPPPRGAEQPRADREGRARARRVARLVRDRAGSGSTSSGGDGKTRFMPRRRRSGKPVELDIDLS